MSQLVRTYTYRDDGELKVMDDEKNADITNLYQNLARGRLFGRVSATVTVKRNNGELIIEGFPNGHSLRNVGDHLALLQLAYEDQDLSDEDPRKLK